MSKGENRVAKQLERGVRQSAKKSYKSQAKADFKKKRFENRATALVRAGENLYDNRASIYGGVISLIVPLLVFVFIVRTLFASDDTQNINTLFMDVLFHFGSESFSTELLMGCIELMQTVSSWDFIGADWAKILPMFGLIIYFFILCILQAAQVIAFVFNLLFISA